MTQTLRLRRVELPVPGRPPVAAAATPAPAARERLLVVRAGSAHDLSLPLPLGTEQVHEVRSAAGASQALSRQPFPVALAVLGPAPSAADVQWLCNLVREQRGTAWILLASRDQLSSRCVRALVLDCCTDFQESCASREVLLQSVHQATRMAGLRSSLANEVPSNSLDRIVGRSAAMTDLREGLGRIARSHASVLLTGESGTGKELLAEAMHQLSDRRFGPFVPVNCGAISRHLIHAELFGHEAGAFTGATQRKLGKLEMASGGTLFLDEVGQLSPEFQTSLLRFLEEGTIERLGGDVVTHVDARVVASSNVNLADAVARGDMREDLYYRLNVVEVPVPALRDRDDDAAEVACHFLATESARTGQLAKRFSAKALAAIRAHSWPGNVRELQNRVRGAFVLAGGRRVCASHLRLDEASLAASETPCSARSLEDYRIEAERVAIEEALKRNANNVSQAASQLGVSRKTFYRLMERTGLALPGRDKAMAERAA